MLVSGNYWVIVAGLTPPGIFSVVISCAFSWRRKLRLDREAFICSEYFIWSSDKSTERDPSPSGGAKPPNLGYLGLGAYVAEVVVLLDWLIGAIIDWLGRLGIEDSADGGSSIANELIIGAFLKKELNDFPDFIVAWVLWPSSLMAVGY